MPGKFEILGELKQEPPFLKKGLLESPITVEETFNHYPQLREIGTSEQYRAYIESIFPDSLVQQLLYHSAIEQIEGTLRVVNTTENGTNLYGFYMADRPVIYGINVTALKVRARIIKEVDALTVVAFDEGDQNNLQAEGVDLVYAKRTNGGEYDYSEMVVFDANNLHALGSVEDVEGFRKWVSTD
jgi:hypothetical protein